MIGVSYGLIAGYSRQRIDNIMMRIVDIIYAYPTLILIILLQVFLTALAQKATRADGRRWSSCWSTWTRTRAGCSLSSWRSGR